ncbi:hypothetical protein P5G51_000630 [Virgibacillus sp. 179-BFC.A HS]|uniref:Uncharacterized protein n=1 Tax=Tigheibacillus jepli TaxID=3035914 RepID=A0ABU5CCR7_9BACI|nr:hypothetical protein [Virgibacillus sp. 179-BFC.A HS]MDY0404113.1 hypothetical protein [Virgibacillus sp. 179-BFC.A HS]
MLDQYLKKHNLHYKVGSKKYIHFLAEIGESKEMQKEPDFSIIDAYGSVYLTELQQHEPLLFRFRLKRAILDKTIKEIRIENDKKG